MKGDSQDLLKHTIAFGNCIGMEYLTWDEKTNRFKECYGWFPKTITGVFVLLISTIAYNTLQGFDETRGFLYLVNVEVVPLLFYIIAYVAQKMANENIGALSELDRAFLIFSVNLGKRSIISEMRITFVIFTGMFITFMLVWILWFAGLPILIHIEAFLIHQMLVALFVVYHVLSFYAYFVIFADRCSILTEHIGNRKVESEEDCVACKVKTEWNCSPGIRFSRVHFCEIHVLRYFIVTSMKIFGLWKTLIDQHQHTIMGFILTAFYEYFLSITYFINVAFFGREDDSVVTQIVFLIMFIGATGAVGFCIHTLFFAKNQALTISRTFHRLYLKSHRKNLIKDDIIYISQASLCMRNVDYLYNFLPLTPVVAIRVLLAVITTLFITMMEYHTVLF